MRNLIRNIDGQTLAYIILSIAVILGNIYALEYALTVTFDQ